METTELLKKVRRIEIKSRGLSHGAIRGSYPRLQYTLSDARVTTVL